MDNKKLIVFDFDYTLAKTSELIWIWSPRGTRQYNNKKYIPVHPSMISKTKLGDDEEINNNSFKEFYSLDVTKAKPIILTINLLKYYLSDCYEYEVHILSARPQSVEEDIISFLHLYNVHTTNINYIGLTNSDPQAKIDYIQKMAIKNTYKSICIYEDNKYVIDNINKNIEQHVETCYVESLNDKMRVTYNEK